MSPKDWAALVGAFLSLSALLLPIWGPRLRKRRPKTEHLPPPEERPDYRHLAQEQRTCPECGVSYTTLSGFRAEQSCDPCVAKRFDRSVENDREFWRGKGWEDAS